MTKIKLCGIKRKFDIDFVNELKPDYIGFVFAKKSKRYIAPKEAEALRKRLHTDIAAVGVFVDADIEVIVELVKKGVIDVIQLHGNEDEAYISTLRKRLDCIIIKAFCIRDSEDTILANASSADFVLLDSGGGSGTTFEWTHIKEIKRPYFLAGGLNPENVGDAVYELSPYAVDASSSLETDGFKDKEKMAAFVNAVRKERTDTI